MKINNIFNFFKSKPFIINFIIAVLFLSTGLTLGIFSKNTTTKDIEKDTLPIVEDKDNSYTNKCTSCIDDNGYFNTSKKYDPKKELFKVQGLGFLFPEGTDPIMSNSSIISMNNKLYKIDIDKLGGLCSPDLECTYDDEENAPNIRTLRIWKNNGKVFAINPQDINLNGSFIGNIVIEKLSSDVSSTNFQYFTTEEVEIWKNILSNPVFLED